MPMPLIILMCEKASAALIVVSNAVAKFHPLFGFMRHETNFNIVIK